MRRRAGILRAVRRGALAAVSVVVASSLLAQTAVTTEASWRDDEWDSAPVAAVDCADADGAFATRGEGHALSGGLLGIDLDAVAEASGVEVTNDGSRSRVTPGTASPVGDHAYANPLDVTALSALNLPLTDLLALPTDTETGVLAQYGRADDDGTAAGASGYVSDSGAIRLDPGNAYPELGRLDLFTLLSSVNADAAQLVDGITGLSLDIGAVAGRAELDGCRSAWTGDLAASLAREYLASDVALELSSPAVETLSSTLIGVAGGLDTLVSGLAGDQGLLNGLTSGISGLLSGLLGTLRLGTISIDSLALSVPLGDVLTLATTEISDDGGVVSIDLEAGTIRVSTAALLGAAYGGSGETLNGLDPNTDLLGSEEVLRALTDALGDALDAWLDDVVDALDEALRTIEVDLTATVAIRALGILPVAEIDIAIDGVGLDALAAGQGVTASARILGIIDAGILNRLVSALVSGLGPVVANLVTGLLPAVGDLVSGLTTAVSALLGTVSGVYDRLFLSGVVALTVNAQSDPLTGSPEPADWAGLDPGRYDVAGLRVGVLDAAGAANVRLYLGRGSVGPFCSLARAATDCPGY
ncbi:choice-of-anchor G family protein [Microbacterium sp. gxy059]|uniref:choice-of-anchor G family protein n=1 Tax=Microbacterium sp. gxy059 TaxID=2957199 RepID=UPI003D9957B2